MGEGDGSDVRMARGRVVIEGDWRRPDNGSAATETVR